MSNYSATTEQMIKNKLVNRSGLKSIGYTEWYNDAGLHIS